MESSVPEKMKALLDAAESHFERAPWAPDATSLFDDVALDGLSQLQRRCVLAASEPLAPDLTMTLDLLEDAILLLHEDGRIIHSNHAAAVVALPVKAGALRSLHALGPSEPWVACRQMLREYKTQSGALERELRDSGTGKYWHVRLSALAYLGVVPRRLVLIIRDITESVEAEVLSKERETFAATGALLAGAAHQAKNTIFGLSATLDALEEQVQRNVPLEDAFVNHLRLGIDRMQALMRDLLDYGNPTLSEMSPVSMAAAVAEAVNACRRLAAQMEVNFVLDLKDDAEVVANPTRLVRALENLVENALQHSPQGGSVTVRLSRSTTRTAGLSRLDVLDQGPGFPPEYIENVFTPFFTRRAGGTGLGLTIAKKIIGDLGGAIRVSNRPSGGAQVAVLLPVHSDVTTEIQFSNLATGRPCVPQ